MSPTVDGLIVGPSSQLAGVTISSRLKKIGTVIRRMDLSSQKRHIASMW